MKNVLTANFHLGSRCSLDELRGLLTAQIENSLDLGWRPRDLLLVTNFEYEFAGVRAHCVPLNERCLTGSKVFALKWLFDQGLADDLLWAHDLDCWQNVWFDPPEMADVGVCEYSRPKVNGGSVFWRPTARDLVEEVVRRLTAEKAEREEPTLDRVFREPGFAPRVTILNSTFNVGCSGFIKRYEMSAKPVRVCHFHPTNRIAWETHALDRNGLDEVPISPRLERLVRKHFPRLAKKLAPDGVQKAAQMRKARAAPAPRFLTKVELAEALHSFTDAQLADREFLQELIQTKIGITLNVTKLRLPSRVQQYFGGFKSKQYPFELASFLAWVATRSHEIDSYLELGVERGGTFFVLDAFLRRLNPRFRGSLGIDTSDRILKNGFPDYHAKFDTCRFQCVAAEKFELNESFGLALIDTNSSYDAGRKLFEQLRGRCRYMAFHDIRFVARKIEVHKLWAELKQQYEHWEFITTDPDYPVPIGLGVLKMPD